MDLEDVRLSEIRWAQRDKILCDFTYMWDLGKWKQSRKGVARDWGDEGGMGKGKVSIKGYKVSVRPEEGVLVIYCTAWQPWSIMYISK